MILLLINKRKNSIVIFSEPKYDILKTECHIFPYGRGNVAVLILKVPLKGLNDGVKT